jgi:hypothetical protein
VPQRSSKILGFSPWGIFKDFSINIYATASGETQVHQPAAFNVSARMGHNVL